MNTEERTEAYKLEQQASDNPGLYHLGIVMLAALGYIYIGLVLALAVAMIAGIVWLFRQLHTSNFNIARYGVEILIGLAVFALTTIRSLFVSVPEPRGNVLDRKDAVPLFQAIDRLRNQLHLPPFDKVILDRDFNASVAQVPRLGLFGWHRNILVIGLPLMMSLPPDNFRAVLAHEMGHVASSHGKFGCWVYRVNETWLQLYSSLRSSNHVGSLLIYLFLAWYVPRFHQVTRAVRKRFEFDADRTAASVVGAKTFIETLMLMELVTIQSQLSEQGIQSQERVEALMADALSYHSIPGDTHPSLCERISSLRQVPSLPPQQQQSAAEVYLGHKLPSIRTSLRV